MLERLVVYGTLAPGRPNAHIMQPINGIWQPASIRGELYADGWGAAMGYPGVIPKEDGEIVVGFIFSSEELSTHWQRLDEFEGEGYQRISVTATLENGEEVDAKVYALRMAQT